MVLVESSVFTELVSELLDDDEYAAFQTWLVANPRAGSVIQGTGGLRKVRWSAVCTGKRGGVRVIYYYLDELAQLRLLLIYRKGIKDDLSASEKTVLRDIKARW